MADREGRSSFVLNADDPLVADLGRDRDLRRREGVTYFGIEDATQALPELQHAHDAKHCRRCGAAYTYERAFVGHLGHYDCPNCEADRPIPDLAAIDIELEGMSGARFTVRSPEGEIRLRLPLPGLYNVYNALGALAAARGARPRPGGRGEVTRGDAGGLRPGGDDRGRRAPGIDPADQEPSRCQRGPADAAARGGRERRRPDQEGLDLWLALNDRIADGRDVSWIWDADFELLSGSVRRVVCSGTRAPEMAVRLKYAGWPAERIEVREAIADSLDGALAAGSGPLYALPTYTALLELRKLLADRGLAPAYWAS